MSHVRSVLLYLSLISGISPIHTFLPAFEHFPYAIFVVLAFNKVQVRTVLIVISLIAFYFLSVLYYNPMPQDLSFSYLIKMLNFMAPLFFFRGNEILISRIARAVFWLFFIVGLLQIFRILVPFELIFELLISRFNGGTHGGYRGVNMLETEPARAGFQLLFLYIIGKQFVAARQRHVMTAVLLFSQVIMIGSTTGILLSFLYFGITMSTLAWKRPGQALMLIILLGVAFYQISDHPKISLVLEYLSKDRLAGAFTALAAISGGRVLGTVTTISEILQYPLGYGANPEFMTGQKVSVDEYNVAGYDTRISARPVSGILSFTYVFGIWGLLLLGYLISRTTRSAKLNMEVAAILLIGVLYSPPGSEIWIIGLLFALREDEIGSSRHRAVSGYSGTLRLPMAMEARSDSAKT